MRQLSEASDASTWVSNSKPYNPLYITDVYYDFLYALIPVCFGILVHSFYRLRFIFKPVRICCDIAAAIGLFWSIFLLIAFDNPNKTKSAIIRNLFCYGIFQGLIVFCDAYMFYKVLLIQTYVFIYT
jgi:hypothetical protein